MGLDNVELIDLRVEGAVPGSVRPALREAPAGSPPSSATNRRQPGAGAGSGPGGMSGWSWSRCCCGTIPRKADRHVATVMRRQAAASASVVSRISGPFRPALFTGHRISHGSRFLVEAALRAVCLYASMPKTAVESTRASIAAGAPSVRRCTALRYVRAISCSCSPYRWTVPHDPATGAARRWVFRPSPHGGHRATMHGDGCGHHAVCPPKERGHARSTTCAGRGGRVHRPTRS